MKRESVKDKAVFYENILAAIDKQERLNNSAGHDMLKLAERMLSYLKDNLRDLRKHMAESSFLDDEEQVEFYKRQLPQILRYFFYYVRLYSLELRMLTLDENARKKLLKSEKKQIERWMARNEGFFRYCKSGSTELDSKYFLKGSRDTNLITDPGQWLFDDEFITVPAYLVGELLAYDRYREYLSRELKFFNGKYKPVTGAEGDDLVWTATKAAATELLYALYSVGAFNKGNVELRQIASKMEKFLGVDLGNYYRYYQDLRIKKIRSQFLRQLLDSSEKRMDDLDENPRQ